MYKHASGFFFVLYKQHCPLWACGRAPLAHAQRGHCGAPGVLCARKEAQFCGWGVSVDRAWIPHCLPQRLAFSPARCHALATARLPYSGAGSTPLGAAAPAKAQGGAAGSEMAPLFFFEWSLTLFFLGADRPSRTLPQCWHNFVLDLLSQSTAALECRAQAHCRGLNKGGTQKTKQ